MKHKVLIVNTNEIYMCDEKNSILDSLRYLKCKNLPIGCCNGGCGVCKIEVVEGFYRKKAMSRKRVSEEEETMDKVLACCIYPESTLTIKVIGRYFKV
jgi:ferredoxin